MSKTLFDDVVQEALRALPLQFARALEEVAIEVRDEPSRGIRHHARLEPGRLLLGLYQGVPLTRRSVEAPPKLPDRIFIFRNPIMEISDSRQQAVENIRSTVLHEIGHYFGMGEEDLEKLGYG